MSGVEITSDDHALRFVGGAPMGRAKIEQIWEITSIETLVWGLDGGKIKNRRRIEVAISVTSRDTKVLTEGMIWVSRVYSKRELQYPPAKLLLA